MRIQCGGATISWAIPRGLSGLDTIQAEQQGYAEAPPKRAGEAQHLRKYSGLRASKRKSFKPVRLAIETNPHSISYTMFEGGGIGTTAVWDIGTYTVHTSKQRREAGYDDSDGESDDELDAAYDEGSKQEHKLYKALHRCWFLDTPPSGDTLAMPFNVRTPAEQDTGKSQSISIELKGARFKKLRITLSRASKDINNVGKRTVRLCPLETASARPSLMRCSRILRTVDGQAFRQRGSNRRHVARRALYLVRPDDGRGQGGPSARRGAHEGRHVPETLPRCLAWRCRRGVPRPVCLVTCRYRWPINTSTVTGALRDGSGGKLCAAQLARSSYRSAQHAETAPFLCATLEQQQPRVDDVAFAHGQRTSALLTPTKSCESYSSSSAECLVAVDCHPGRERKPATSSSSAGSE